MIKLFMLCALGASMVTTNGLATGDERDKVVKDINYEVREYVREHIMPVVMQKRREFDVKLNETEHSEVASYREEISAMREELQHNELVKSDDIAAKEEQRHEYNLRMKEIIEEVGLMAENHKNDLDEIFDNFSVEGMKWKDDIKQIENIKPGRPELICIAGNSSYTPLLTGTFGDSWINIDGRYGRGIFLILNPGTIAPNSVSLNVYPNPASTSFSLNLTGTGNIDKLIIIDMAGKLVGEQENVSPTGTISCKDMSSGIYLVLIYANGEMLNKKLLVSR